MKAEQDRLRNLVGVDEEGVDLAFCKSLRQACRSPKPNIDEIECLSLDSSSASMLVLLVPPCPIPNLITSVPGGLQKSRHRALKLEGLK